MTNPASAEPVTAADTRRAPVGREPTVSLVIPAYNKAAYLAEAIESVLAQDHPRLDLVVVDDGSTDETPRVLEAFGPGVRWVRQPNSGQSAAMNRGWSMTDGELVGYLSADDVLAPQAVSALAEALVCAPEAVCAYGDYQLINAHGRVVRDVVAPDFDYHAMVRRLLCPPGPGALFTRAAAAAAGWWNTSLRLIPDYDFWLRLGLSGPFVHVPGTLARFRVHDSGLSFAAPSARLAGEYVKVMQEWFASTAVPDALRSSRAQALSSAYLLEARGHLRAQRHRPAAASAARAVALYPANVNLAAARLLAHGVFHHRREAFHPDPGAPAGHRPAWPIAAAIPAARAGQTSGRPVVLTGGSGSLGAHVRAALADCQVTLLGRRPPVGRLRHEQWVWADPAAGPHSSDLSRRLGSLDLPDSTVLCHLTHSRLAEQTATMTLDLLNAVNACPRINRVVLVSTAAVYGPQHRGPVDEHARCRPRGSDAKATLAAERLWRAALRRDCELVVLRLGAVLSIERASSYQLVEDALRRPVRATLLRSLRQGTGMHYVTVGDAAAAVRFAVDAELPRDRTVFNVVDEPAGGPVGPLTAANGDYAALQDEVRRLASRPPLPRLPLHPAAIDAAARLLGQPRPGRRLSAAALRSAGFVGTNPLGEELAKIVATLVGTTR
ncbi:glycosyltransferase [Frankia sp. AgB1.9]|uniref:glycosyltransferase n=1 Tax=unclassified Frankia TaxID=2632575 RepID=UPI00193177B6|nr:MULTISPECIES: glycosyltransferase [unclassified Frankia]MBL7493552.1 glycosyltransferase [Frankia sp. AgW1.1]MBL7553457.1 glycosyltransferase [Frankia sp. AgB1.9]MBL7622310.1 glycosyltransferase [Frankia sp. AgB1.8]